MSYHHASSHLRAQFMGTAIGGSLLLALLPSAALANPLDGHVTTGAASIANSSAATTVKQSSEGVVIDWSSFDIGSGQTTTFAQPNAQAIAVNRIGGNSASQIFGTLDANGRIVLINGNGLLFGKGSQVNVGSLVATSTDANNKNALAGKFNKAGSAGASVTNDGKISASPNGLVALVAPNVTNNGTVNAKLGTVVLGGANKFTVDFNGDGLVSFVAHGTNPGQVTNTGRLNGANVTLTVRSAEGLAAGVVNVGGTVTAEAARAKGGSIVLDAGRGGSIDVSGALNASGKRGGGSVSTNSTAGNLAIEKPATISADATQSGNGGSIRLVSRSNTQFAGTISAKGAGTNGKGGSAEIYGHGTLAFTGFADLTGANGKAGTLTLDPSDYYINDTGVSPVAGASAISASALESELASASVVLKTGGPNPDSAGQKGDFFVESSVTWSSDFSLKLKAKDSITLEDSVTISSTGEGSLTLDADDGGRGRVGSILGEVNFLGSSQASATGGGSIFIFYDPVDYDHPIDYARTDMYVTGGGAGYAYMLVNTLDELQDIGFDTNTTRLAGSYALTHDLDATVTADWYSGQGFDPIGTAAMPFEGSFDGMGHTINGLTIDRPTTNYVGLFGVVGVPSADGPVNNLISNLNVTNANIVGSDYVGAIVGSDGIINGTEGAPYPSALSRLSVSGSVSGYQYVAGIVGESESAMDHLSAAVDVTGVGGLGGITGFAESISNSNSSGKIDGSSGADAPYYATGNIGGLAGFCERIENSYSSATVIGSSDVGGLVGSGETISGSSATGNVSGRDISSSEDIGGLAGSASNVSHSFATGSVTGNNYVGGLVGAYGLIRYSYATGNVSSFADASASSSDIGGIIGITESAIKYSYETGSVSGGTNVGGLVGYAGDFDSGNGNGPDQIVNSYALGNVTGSTAVGGLVGLAEKSGPMQDAYATGAISGSTNVGGVIGDLTSGSGALVNLYWDLDTSDIGASNGVGNVTNASGVTGLTTAQFQSGLPSGFSATIWGSDPSINDAFPYLLATPPG